MEKWHDNNGNDYSSSYRMFDDISAGFDKSIARLKKAYEEKSEAKEDEYLKGLAYAIELLEYHKHNWYNS